MISLQLELVLVCRGCEAPVALNGIVPSVACDRCKRTATISDDEWRAILAGARDEAATMADNEERDLPFDAGPGRLRRIVRCTPPRCSACRTVFAGDRAMALADGATLACEGCGREALLRRLPAHIAIAFFGEDRELLAGTKALVTTVPLSCVACAAALEVDGSSRVVVCRYCGASSHLPDTVWARLHPIRPVSPFYAFFEPARAAATVSFEWEGVTDVVSDIAGNLYVTGRVAVLGDIGWETFVCSLDPQLSLRWVQLGDFGERIALFGERVVIWGSSNSPRLVACDDGRMLDEPFPLSGSDIVRFYLDRDGTCLQVRTHQITRHEPDGECVDLYTGKSRGFFAQLVDVFKTDPLADQPGGLTGALLADGTIAALYHRHSAEHDVDEVVLAAVDGATGEIRFRRIVQVADASLSWGRLHADSQGRILFLDRARCEILRFDHETTTVIAAEGFLGSAVMTILPNDEMWLLTINGAARRIAPDGRLLYANEAARRHDREVALPGR